MLAETTAAERPFTSSDDIRAAIERYQSDEDGSEPELAVGARGTELAVDRLARQLDEPLRTLRALHDTQDEWAAFRAIHPGDDAVGRGKELVEAEMEALAASAGDLRRSFADQLLDPTTAARYVLLKRFLGLEGDSQLFV
jgi:hypothetical protein